MAVLKMLVYIYCEFLNICGLLYLTSTRQDYAVQRHWFCSQYLVPSSPLKSIKDYIFCAID